ncbi:YueI family protein [Bacillaceae bacterium CLA-AA-H227]|uniref:YueI family protein n=1 Tax=Robertmurraya yapensis (ex Hitch et al 2024) TaxID=3133160 RepID=A0ACC6SD39_9BACI
MPGPNLDDYLQQGIYGQKEINPDERRKFLGTLRERVVIALTQVQVREENIFTEVEEALKSNSDATLLLNGNIDYAHLSKYIKLASKYNAEYTIVTNNEHNSEIGLVLAHEYAVDKEDIYVTQKKIEYVESKEKKGLLSGLTKIFKK